MAKPSFRDFVLSKYPNLPKTQIDQLDSFDQKNVTADAIKQGKLSIEDLPADQRAGAVANLTPEEIGRKNTVDAQKSMQGLMDTFDKLKSGVDTVSVGNTITGKLGLDSAASNFNATKALAGRYLAKLVEKNRISDADAKFYQDQINNFSPIGLSDVQKSKIDNIKEDVTKLAGFKPEDFKTSTNADTGKNTSGSNPLDQILQGLNKFGQNATNDVNSIWQGIGQMPAQMGQQFVEGGGGIPGIVNVGANAVKGQVQEYGKLLSNPVESVTQRPASTFMDILPFLGAMTGNPKTTPVSTIAPESGLTGVLSKAPKIASETKVPLMDKVLGKAGKYLREDVVKIETEPSIWGAQKEAAIKQTLNDLGIKGTPDAQYAQLAPTMEKLTGSIEDSSLYSNPKPIKVSMVIDDFEKNLGSEIRRSTLDKGSVRSLAEGYIQDVYSAANDGKVIPETVQSPDLFKLKKLVNDDYQVVAKKLKNNIPLTDKERVVAVARQTLDDIIANKHPDVKKLTRMQSHLYDAVDSIYNARRSPGRSIKVLGSEIPIPKEITQTAEDYLGRTLERRKSIPVTNNTLERGNYPVSTVSAIRGGK